MSHRDPVECSGLLIRLRLTHYGYRLTVLRNDVSDTDRSSLNWATGNFHRCEQSKVHLIFQTACGRPPEGLRTGGAFKKMVNIFAYTCPNRSGVGAINNPDRSEQVFDAYYISEVSKKIFMDDISMVRP